MKIKAIKLQNHPVLGNFDLDFTDDNNKVYDTIIIAGENGTGKTALLEVLYSLTNYTLDHNQRNEFKIFEVEFSRDELLQIFSIKYPKSEENTEMRTLFFDNIVDVVFHFNFNITNWNQVNVIFRDIKQHSLFEIMGNEFTDSKYKSFFRSISCNAEISFMPEQIRQITAKDVDLVKQGNIRTSSNLATEITQLLIDIHSQDSNDFAEWGMKNVGNPVEELKLNVRMKRFTSAFNSIFPTKRFKKVDNRGELKKVIFEEYGNEMTIEVLSSGEKQIVFRGGFLLKDIGSTKGAIVLIDEPEISLHPNWQLEIMNFYKKLFINEDGIQSSQIFVATHSPFIIHNANRYDDKVIILGKDATGNISVQKESKFYSWSSEEFIEEAFKIDTFNKISSPVVFLEGETDEIYFNKVVEVFSIDTKGLIFKWVGYKDSNGNDTNSGIKALDKAYLVLKANPLLAKQKVIMLYDCDAGKQNLTEGNVCIYGLPNNSDNKTIKGGIENLFDLTEIKDLKEVFYETKTNDGNDGGYHSNTYLNKMKLCKYICNELDKEKQKMVFAKLANVIGELIKFIES